MTFVLPECDLEGETLVVIMLLGVFLFCFSHAMVARSLFLRIKVSLELKTKTAFPIEVMIFEW